MSDRAHAAAMELRDRFAFGPDYVVTDDDLARVARAVELVIHYREELKGRLTEQYQAGHLALRADLSVAQQRPLIGHGLGHHLMHAGHRFVQGTVTTDRFEREADVFAGYLFLEADWALKDAYELAREHRLPLEFVNRWLELRGPRVQLSGQIVTYTPEEWAERVLRHGAKAE